MQSDRHVLFRLRDGREVDVPFELPGRSLPVHPAQLYDAINLALLSCTLWYFYPMRRRVGGISTIANALSTESFRAGDHSN